MKKILKLTLGILTTLTIVFSCSNETDLMNNPITENLELNQKIQLNNTTTMVSNNFLNMGITEVVVENKSKIVLYKVKTQKTFYLNGENIDLSTYNIVVENNFISIKNDNSFKLSVYQNKPYVVSGSYSGFPKSDFYSNKNFNILLFFMKEIITNDEFKLNSKTFLKDNTQRRGGCSFWNTYYVYGTGGSQSVAQANLTSEISSYDLSGCSSIGGSNSGCLWAEYGCVSSQAYCC
jgi:hypothetical protein